MDYLDRIIQGDCEQVLKEFPDDSIRIFSTSINAGLPRWSSSPSVDCFARIHICSKQSTSPPPER